MEDPSPFPFPSAPVQQATAFSGGQAAATGVVSDALQHHNHSAVDAAATAFAAVIVAQGAAPSAPQLNGSGNHQQCVGQTGHAVHASTARTGVGQQAEDVPGLHQAALIGGAGGGAGATASPPKKSKRVCLCFVHPN